ncbi:partner of Y14 and mago-like [Sabethes cyaneus]|uniref:partner of Y14 and mago-like n=1 Tax=Sabethes cyaneus TaxID=53552 RepID=UPI00237D4395|nr:partner of Y14 and mago-like [Sabethes cyaneus]
MTSYATDSQGKFITASQRPDGTWRKPRRIRDGYVPQEEVPLYKSKGKLFSQKPVLPPGLPAEMAHKAKEKRDKAERVKQQREAEISRRTTPNSVPGLLILAQDDKTYQRQQQHQKSRPANSKPKKKTVELPDVLLEQKQMEDHNRARPQPLQNQKQGRSKQQDDLTDTTKAMVDLQVTGLSDDHPDLSKKLRKLRKKICEIEVIEERLRSNDCPRPDKDQIEKAKRKPEILKEIEELERSMAK